MISCSCLMSRVASDRRLLCAGGARPGGGGAMRGRDGEDEVSDERMGGRAVDVSVYAPILVKSDMAVDRARDERRIV